MRRNSSRRLRSRSRVGRGVAGAAKGDSLALENRLELILRVTKLLAGANNPNEAIAEVLELVCRSLCPGDQLVWCGYWTPHKSASEEHLRLSIQRHVGKKSAAFDEFAESSLQMTFARGNGLPGNVWDTRRERYVSDITNETNLRRYQLARDCNFRSAVAFPIMHDHEFLGVIEFFSENICWHEQDVGRLLQSLGLQIGQLLAMKKAEARLKLLASMIVYAPLPIMTLDAEWRISSWNGTCEQFFGRSAEQALGQPADRVLPSSLIQDVKRLEQQLPEGRIINHPLIVHFENRSVPVEVDFSDAVSPFEEKVLAVRDVSQRFEAEKRLSEFYSVLSHEIRTPLTSIRAALGLILGNVADNIDERRDLLVVANDNVDRLVRLLNDMLDINKIEAGMIQLRKGNAQANKLIQRSIEGLRSTAEAAGIQLTEGASTDIQLDVDADRIVQVLTNLISNAIKFSPSGSEVIVSAHPLNAEWIRFEVNDSGIGIPPHDLPKLFQKFQQLDASDTRLGGTGLGLAICKALIDQHGGKIGVESTPEQGSVFWFELPCILR